MKKFFIFQYACTENVVRPEKLLGTPVASDCCIGKVETFCPDGDIWIVLASTDGGCSLQSFEKTLCGLGVVPLLFPDYKNKVECFENADELRDDFMYGLIQEACSAGDVTYESFSAGKRVKRVARYLERQPAVQALTVDEFSTKLHAENRRLIAVLAERERFVASLEAMVAELRAQLAQRDRQVKALLAAI